MFKYSVNIPIWTIIVNILGLILAIAFAIFADNSTESGSTASIIYTVLIYLLTFSLVAQFSIQQIKEQTEKNHALIEKYVFSSHFESMDELSASISCDLIGATKVFNTAVGLSDDYASLDGANIYRKIFKKWYATRSSGEWHDIVGLREFHSDRYKKILLKNRKRKTVKVSVIRPYSPITNFIVIEGNLRSVVYYGFGNNKAGKLSVFRTANAEIVRYFENRFEKLRSYCWDSGSGPFNLQLDYRRGSSINDHGFIDKEGLWVTLAYQIINDQKVPLSVGLIEVKFEKSATETVDILNAYIFNMDGSKKAFHEHKSTSSQSSSYRGMELIGKNSIWVQYGSDGENYVFYEFEKDAVSGFHVCKAESIKTAITGYRISDSELERDFRNAIQNGAVDGEFIASVTRRLLS